MSIRFMWGGFSTVHNVSLVHGSDALAAVSLRVMERITSDAFRRVPGDELDGLDNTIDHLRRVSV